MKHYFFSLTAIILIFFLSACNGCDNKKPDNAEAFDLEMEDPTLDALDSAYVLLKPTDSMSAIHTLGAPSTLEDAFMSAFRNCWKDNTFEKNVIFTGPSNPKYIGTILSKNQSITWKSLDHVLSHNKDIMGKFITIGTLNNICNDSTTIKKAFNTILAASLSKIVDVNVKAEIGRIRDLHVKSGQWRSDDLRVGDFNKFLDTCKIEGMDDYKSYLRGNNIIVTKAIILENFQVEMNAQNTFRPEVKAKLLQGVNVNLGDNTSVLNAGIEFKMDNQRNSTVQVSSTSPAIILVGFQKIKRVTRK